MWAIFLEQDFVPPSFPKPDEIWCTRSLENTLVERYGFIMQNLAVKHIQFENTGSEHYYQKKEQLCLVETRSAAKVRPSTQYLTDAGYKHRSQRHLFSKKDRHRAAFIFRSLKPARRICLLLIPPSQREKKKKKDTCDWPAGHCFCFKLAVIRDRFRKEQVLIAFF